MAAEYFTAIYNDFKERSTSPFFVTFFTVSILKKWEIIYTLLYFDDTCNLKCRIDYLKATFGNIIYLGVLTNNLLITFGLLILGFACIYVTKGLTDILYTNLIPALRNKVANKLVIDKGIYENVRELLEKKTEEILQKNETLQTLETENSGHKVERNRLVNLVGLKEAEVATYEEEKITLNNTISNLNQKQLEHAQIEAHMETEINNLKSDINDISIKRDDLLRDGNYLLSILTEDLKNMNIGGKDILKRFPPKVTSDYTNLEVTYTKQHFIDIYNRIYDELDSARVKNYDLNLLAILKEMKLIDYATFNDLVANKNSEIRITEYGFLMFRILRAIDQK
jgi:hypothetical protein